MNARTFGIALLAGAAALLGSIGASAAPVVYDGALFRGLTRAGSVPTGDGWINNRSSGFYTIAVGGWDSIGCPACGSATGPYAYAITVTGNAPEPMTLALVGIGIAGFGLTRRKRSNSSFQAA